MKRLALIALLATALAGAGLAVGQPVQSGNLRIAFDAGFAPHALPRDHPAPVRVTFAGSIVTSDGSRPPQVRRISIALNRYGKLTTRGLPTCKQDELESTSSATALARCRSALVGSGHFRAVVAFSGQPQLPVKGRVLAFLGRTGHGTAILVHVAASSPITATVVLVFNLTHPRKGRFGTIASTTIPKIASDLGYVTNLSLTLGRRYDFEGRRLSFISASCAAPKGFPGALFSFARGSFLFADGRRLTSTVVRDCVVR
ncbi:MAG TPA: hypothetical protein VHQ43_01940 [Solirubrobacterales bacterium]|jgi:hypothetical protein|nr:hypothetical protein [Solirubrobacterales bacterium]